MSNMQNTNRTRRREPMSDTQLLLTITICIFFGLYIRPVHDEV